MTETKKLTGVRYTPSEAQLDVRWTAANSKKHALLRNSDWTQLRDVYALLTPEQRLAWDGWRRRVRLTKASDFPTPSAFEEALSALSTKLPTDIVQTAVEVDPEVVRADRAEHIPHLTPLDEGTSINAQDAIWEMAQLALQTVAKKCHIFNIHTFSDQVAEATDLLVDVMTGDELDMRRYPLLNIVSIVTERDAVEVANDIITKQRRWSIATAYIQGVAERTLAQIDPTVHSSEHNRRLIMELDADIQEHIRSMEVVCGH